MTDRLPIKMLHDRVLVREPREEGERRSTGGILIPATAQVSKRLIWAEVLAVGNHVRAVEVGDRVLFSPDDRHEVEIAGESTCCCASATCTPSPPSASSRTPGCTCRSVVSRRRLCRLLSRRWCGWKRASRALRRNRRRSVRAGSASCLPSRRGYEPR